MTQHISARGKALIIGGGVGGPAAALFLKRAGFEVEVYEAQPEAVAMAGSFLNLASNGLRVLQQLGLEHIVAAEGFRIPQLVMWSGGGKRLGAVRNGVAPGEGPVSVVLRRSSLHRILRDATQRAGIPFHYERQLVDLTLSDEPRVTARFADGSVAEGDLLIGCDGIHSRVRQLIDPQAARPSYTGLLSCGGYGHSTTLQPTPETQHFIFGRRAFFGYFVKEGGGVWWFSNISEPGEPRRSELARVSHEMWQQRLLHLHDGDQPSIQAIIRDTTEPLAIYPIYDLPTTRHWHRGPLVLLGDAAHATAPSAGQGASLALEDAIVLAKCLRDIPDTAAAFAAYERLRRARAEQVVAFSRQRGNNKVAPNAFARWLRDLMLPILLRRVANPTELAWLYGYHESWEERLALADQAVSSGAGAPAARKGASSRG
jgi:2-polyprenyl-6-methoxyphenol hydroxylase-like FAD-dependent oxidoreductase